MGFHALFVTTLDTSIYGARSYMAGVEKNLRTNKGLLDGAICHRNKIESQHCGSNPRSGHPLKRFGPTDEIIF